MSRINSVKDHSKLIIDEIEERTTEDELFLDSLDCIASSSRSCSASNSDSDPESNPEKMAKFPFSVSKFAEEYDIWISEPAPVVERRGHLLRQMGLLGCSKPLASRRTLSCDELTIRGDICGGTHNSSSLTSPLGTIDIGSRRKGAGMLRLHSSSHSSTSALASANSTETKSLAASPRKPPLGKSRKRIEDSYKANGNADSNSLDYSSSEEVLLGSDDEGSYEVCRIKDLDNGKEFVVNEVNKLREVGTGKQLTMEEFEITLGHSPIVQELMRRHRVQNATDPSKGNNIGSRRHNSKKKVGGWFSALRSKERSSDEKDTGSDKAGRRSSSATDDSLEVCFHGPERVRVKQYGKQSKELTRLYKTNEIQAHNGSIWTLKFSLDGKYLASAGEDRVIHVWQVLEVERRGELSSEKNDDLFNANGSPEMSSMSSLNKKSTSVDHFHVPETMFSLSDKPVCSFFGHYHDVLDLSWSKSHHILSSSMDKTVRLWHLKSKTCLKIFSHNDYVTCIHFNPVDDRYFISGSLDTKIRIWSIPERQVVDWTDLREMVTSASYTPDGQAAYFGTYKGNCWLYHTFDNKLDVKHHINLENKKKKVHLKKITGFQFAPGSSSEVLISSADSRVRVVDGVDLVHKFKGFRNTNSQISASITANGKYVVAASEDSFVYVWKNETDTRIDRTKTVSVTHSYEYFHCQDVSAAIPWPGFADSGSSVADTDLAAYAAPSLGDLLNGGGGQSSKTSNGTICSATNGYFFDRVSATWPEEKLDSCGNPRSRSVDLPDAVKTHVSVCGMVIVTAGLRGEIRTFQNFGVPVRV